MSVIGNRTENLIAIALHNPIYFAQYFIKLSYYKSFIFLKNVKNISLSSHVY